MPIIRAIYSTGFPSIISHLIISIVLIFYNHVLAQYGANAIAALGICFRVNGLVMMILYGIGFGLLPIAYEDIQYRAAGFANDLISKFGADIKIGIAAGKVFAGFIGNNIRISYSAFGETINLSARICQLAVYSEILISEKFQKRIFNKYSCLNIGQKELKGFENVILIFHLKDKIKEANVLPEKNDIIGRNEELQILNNYCVKIFQQKFAGLIYVAGEAGIGKSRFLQEFFNCIKDKAEICKLRADSILKKSMNPVIDFLDNYFQQIYETLPDKKLRQFENKYTEIENALTALKAEEELSAAVAEAKRYIAGLIGVGFQDSILNIMDAQTKYENTMYGLKAFFKGLSRIKPIVIALEDIHWYDEDTERFITTLSYNINNFPIVIIASTRLNDEGKYKRLRVSDDCPQQEIFLKFLTIEETEKIMRECFYCPPAQKLLLIIFEKSRGNPFIIEQLYHYLSEKNLILQKNNEFDLINENINIPRSISSIIIERIDRMPPDFKEFVMIAAIIGVEFDTNVITLIFKQLNYDGVLPEWAYDPDFYKKLTLRGKMFKLLIDGINKKMWLEQSEFLYRFEHALLREAAYSMQLKMRLKFFHLLTARSIEELYNRNGRYFLSLAHHYSLADDMRKTKFYLYKAGVFARKNFEMDEAIKIFDRLIELLPAIEEKIEILMIKADILENIGKWDLAAEIFKIAIDYAIEKKMMGYIVKLKISSGIIHWKKSNLNEAMTLLNEAVLLSEQSSDDRQIALAYRHIGIIYMDRGEFEPALGFYTKALTASQNAEDTLNTAWTVFSIGYLYYELKSDYKSTENYYNQAIELFQKIGDDFGLTNCYRSFGFMYHYNVIDYNKALDFYNKSLEMYRNLGRKREICYTANKISDIYILQGKINEAIQGYYRSLKLAEELNDPAQITSALNQTASALTLLAEYDKALEYLERAKTISIQTKNESQLYWILYYKGQTYFYKGDYKKAAEDFKTSLELGLTAGIVNMLGGRYSFLAHSYMKIGDIKNGFKTVLAALLFAEKVGGNDHLNGRTHLACAIGLDIISIENLQAAEYSDLIFQILQITGLPQKPAAFFEKSIETAKKAGFDETLIPAYHEYGRYLIKSTETYLKGKKIISQANRRAKKLSRKNDVETLNNYTRK